MRKRTTIVPNNSDQIRYICSSYSANFLPAWLSWRWPCGAGRSRTRCSCAWVFRRQLCLKSLYIITFRTRN